MPTTHLLTKDNETTIRAAIESVGDSAVVVGDLGSTDDTVAVCRSLGATVLSVKGVPRHEARNRMVRHAPHGPHLWIEPWEAVVAGHAAFRSFSGHAGLATVMHGKTFSQDARLWDGKAKFVNPVFERLDVPEPSNTGLTIYSNGGPDPEDAMLAVEAWKRSEPLSKQPYYYQSCLLMSQGKYEEFIRAADHYLFLDKTASTPATMTRYYYAAAQLTHRRAAKPALQNLNLCLCVKPLMAEFWCLTGDVYYHLLGRFEYAKEFYENALVLGRMRRRGDGWPIDVSKYREYPEAMMKSCDEILGNTYNYA